MTGFFAHLPFGVTHPLGLPRPIDVDNFFGAKSRYFAENMMPIPSGCLAHFDTEVYRPYVKELVEALNCREFGWSGPAITEDPPRYCLLRDGSPARIPHDLAQELPEPPRIGFEQVLSYFDRNHVWAAPMQLLDVLTLASEDLGPERFAAATAGHPWVAEFMR
jgi:hypothetical protein